MTKTIFCNWICSIKFNFEVCTPVVYALKKNVLRHIERIYIKRYFTKFDFIYRKFNSHTRLFMLLYKHKTIYEVLIFIYEHIYILHIDRNIVYNSRLHTSMTILRKYNFPHTVQEPKVLYLDICIYIHA